MATMMSYQPVFFMPASLPTASSHNSCSFGGACAVWAVPVALPGSVTPALTAWQAMPQLASVGPSLACAEGATASASSSSPSINGRVWALSQDEAGCRLVQSALEESTDCERGAIARELMGKVWNAIHCANANHVLQKCIMTMRPADAQFIIDELMLVNGRPCQAAQHKYGCRILQRLLEHCRSDQVRPLVECLLRDSVPLSRHQYASYVMLQVLEHGSDEQQRLIKMSLAAKPPAVGCDAACAVICKALECGSKEESVILAKSIIRSKGLIVRMARTRRGHFVIKAIMQLLRESQDVCELETVVNDILAMSEHLSDSRYGRAIIAACRHQMGSSEETNEGTSDASNEVDDEA